MLKIIGWKASLIILLCLLSLYLALPTILPNSALELLSKYNILPNTKVNLGLDLRGGASLLLEIDSKSYQKEKIQTLIDKLRIELKNDKILPKNISANSTSEIEEQIVIQFTNEDANKESEKEKFIISKVKKVLEDNSDNFIQKITDIKRIDNSIVIGIPQSFTISVENFLLNQSIDIVRRRIDESGTKEIDIQKQGNNRILLQVPGVYDTQEIKRILGRTAKLTFHFVLPNFSIKDIREGSRLPIGSKLMPMDISNSEQKAINDNKKEILLPVGIKPVMSGDMLIDAHASIQEGQHIVYFKLTKLGTKVFAEATSKNIGKSLAIVLDGKIISAPVIKDSILSGSGVISGNFTSNSANELAILLRSGALPTPLKIVEERNIGPALGEASIKAGTNAVFIAAVGVMAFMVLFYSFWGIFANIALIFNFVMIIAGLGIIGATLTLPGIAGIALTLGMAVDANVLIYERMKEEYNKGKSLLSSIDNGYKFAFVTILDSNITTIAVAIILYIFGSGPIRGFSVSLTLGILCSLFTSVILTKLLVALWYRMYKPKSLGL